MDRHSPLQQAIVSARDAPVSQPPGANLELSILMPCLNEAETLKTCIRKARSFLVEHNVTGEIVIGDNGSTDGSQALAAQEGARVIEVPVRGYGSALFHATLAARGRYVIMGDSDDSYDFTSLAPFLEKLREGYDLVMGNRFLGGIRPGAMPWKNRHIGNPILSGIGRLFFRCPARDFHCGLRGFSAAAFQRLDLQTTGMEYASEMVIKASLMGMRITEVPTILYADGRNRPPHLRPWYDGWRHLRFMLLYSPRWLFLIPGIIVMLLGATVMAFLLTGDIPIGHIYFGVHTMIYAGMALLVGYQAVTFNLFTRIFAISEGLLPEDPGLKRMFRFITLESGLVLGGALMALGLAASVFAVVDWDAKSFGPLDPEKTLRLVVPASVTFVLGIQTVLSSFFLSVLGLRVRRRQESNETV